MRRSCHRLRVRQAGTRAKPTRPRSGSSASRGPAIPDRQAEPPRCGLPKRRRSGQRRPGSRGARPRRWRAAGSPRTASDFIPITCLQLVRRVVADALRQTVPRFPTGFCRAGDLDRIARIEACPAPPRSRPAAGSRCPRATPARRPSSTTSVPWRASRSFSHSLNELWRARARREFVPSRLPGEHCLQRALAQPLQITVATPAAVAMSAATTFERIPPEPSGEVVWPISSSSQRLEVGDLARPARARRAAGRRVEAVDVGQQHEQVGARRASPPAPPGSRCRQRRSRRSPSCRSR